MDNDKLTLEMNIKFLKEKKEEYTAEINEAKSENLSKDNYLQDLKAENNVLKDEIKNITNYDNSLRGNRGLTDADLRLLDRR